MSRGHRTFVYSLLALQLLTAFRASAEPVVFGRLKTLVGEWEATTSRGATVRVSYRLMSNDSVLVQTFGVGSGHETLTTFHPDGERLLATHYCAQGNQPRLKFDPASKGDWFVFTFVDATNLRPAASHMVRLELRLDTATQYTGIETYSENGKLEVTTLLFRRRRYPPARSEESP